MAEALAGKTQLRWACLHFNSFGEEATETLIQVLGDRQPLLGAVPPGMDPEAEYEDYGESKSPLATENLLENIDGGSEHPIIVHSGRHPATFYLC